ncbi:glutamine-dependent NAD(+) synthetase [Trichoderma pleuroticola]
MPNQHKANCLSFVTSTYNCKVVGLDDKILFIRPKMHYREMRYFTPWLRPTEWEEFHSPKNLQKLQGSTHVPFGDCIISTPDSCFGTETCEEIWSPDAPHVPMTLDGVEIITNSSASHFSLQKLDTRLKLIGEATRKCGGVYMYSNVSGGDGDRLYFDGCAMIFCNGQLLAKSPQISLNEVDIVTATIELEGVRAYRSSISRAIQAARNARKYYRIQTFFELSPDEENFNLRRLIPLSGGLDSCATAVSVFSMCRLSAITTVKRLFGKSALPRTPQELCHRVLHTVYMGMSKQSSHETRQSAKDLSEATGSYHIDLDIDSFKVEGGSGVENLMLQIIQARTRMVLAGGGGLLVPGSANVGEALRGYMTKYDCASADINPIGSIDKAALKGFIAWTQVKFDIPCLEDFLTATPTAELEPVTEDYTQSDEADMGITYAELTAFGRLRKERKMGPLSMWQHLVQNPSLEPAEIAEKVKFFFVKYYGDAITRHKATTLTPACNDDYSPDDNRFDLRPFLYPPFWQSWSFKRIDRELARIEEARKKS